MNLDEEIQYHLMIVKRLFREIYELFNYSHISIWRCGKTDYKVVLYYINNWRGDGLPFDI